MSDKSATTINIPQILVLLVIGFLALRWYFSSSSSSSDSRRRTAQNVPGRGRPINPAAVEQIAQMFPQLNRRDIMWDLQRNGGSVQATTERILSGRSLETPPLSYQPQIPNPLSTSTPSSRPSGVTPNKPAHPDLITRYNLHNRLSQTPTESGSESDASQSKAKSGWSTNKAERQQLLQKRREEMILAARRKMEEKDRAEKSAKAAE